MIQKVDCVYRVHTYGEIIPAKFNILTGQIIGFEEFITLDMEETKKYASSYVDGRENILEYLVQKMIEWKQAIVVIGYSNVGTIIVTEKTSFYQLDSCFYARQKTECPLLKPYCREVEVIGAIKTPIYTLSIQTPQAFFIVDKTGGQKIVHTRYGRKQVAFCYDSLEDRYIDMALQVSMCQNPYAFATCKVEGVLSLVFINNNQLEILGGNKRW